MVRLSRRWFLATFVVMAGCLSPTLPLPPPADPEVATVGQGLVELSGEVPEANVPVLAENRRTFAIAGQYSDAAGGYRFQLAAEPGDPLRLWYMVGYDRSEDAEFTVPAVGLPVPPVPVVTAPDADGLVTLTGSLPRPLAEVFVRHVANDESTSAPADGDGRYEVVIAAATGDVLELWYEYGPDASGTLTFAVP